MKCPHIITKRADDEAQDFCELTEKPSGRMRLCVFETGSTNCGEYLNGLEVKDTTYLTVIETPGH